MLQTRKAVMIIMLLRIILIAQIKVKLKKTVEQLTQIFKTIFLQEVTPTRNNTYQYPNEPNSCMKLCL